jgi:AcrR family transcriptional regulator
MQQVDRFVATWRTLRSMAEAVLRFPALAHGLPAPPPTTLDPFLDSAARCFARYGVQRTSVQDVAQELKVNRTTVYRQVGNVESMVRLLAARELHRLLAELPSHVDVDAGPQTIVDVLAAAIKLCRSHPVVAKVLADEPELLGQGLADMPALTARIVAVVVPLLEEAMNTRHLARRDPVLVAEWLVRIAITAIVAPPPGDLKQFLGEVLVPALAPKE